VRRAKGLNLLLRDRDTGEQRLARELLVREVVLRRDIALVAPPDMPMRPVEGLLSEALVDAADR
jgi:hypothetical protein